MSDLTLQDIMAEIRSIKVSHQAGFNIKALAVYMNVSETTARRLMKQPGAPKAKAFQTDDDGNAVERYLKSDIDAWMQSAPISRAS